MTNLRPVHAARLLVLQQGHRGRPVGARQLAAAPKKSKIKDLVSQRATSCETPSAASSGRDSLASRRTKKNNGKIYAALYELNDPELIPALETFGKDCNLILANGASRAPATG